jgi:hypothetical protein
MPTPIADEFEEIRYRLRELVNEREAAHRYAGLSEGVRDELSKLLRGGLSLSTVSTVAAGLVEIERAVLASVH